MLKESTGRVRAAIHNPIEPYRATLDLDGDAPEYAAGFSDIKGQEHVK